MAQARTKPILQVYVISCVSVLPVISHCVNLLVVVCPVVVCGGVPVVAVWQTVPVLVPGPPRPVPAGPSAVVIAGPVASEVLARTGAGSDGLPR